MGDVVRLKKNQPVPAVLQLKIELAEIKPTIWRRVVVPETITLGKLHQVIQDAMGWFDCHLHEFEIAGERYGVPDPDFDWGLPVRSERRVRLNAALGGVKSFGYTYDFGDNWDHRIKVEKALPPDPTLKVPLCLAGANACPPEDVGSVPGYCAFVEASANPKHPEHREMIQWFGGPFDPSAFDIDFANSLLKKIKL